MPVDVMMKPISILIVLDTFPTLSETFLYTLIQNLMDAGMKIKVMARKRGKADQVPAFAGSVHYLPGENLPPLFKTILLLGMGLRYLVTAPVKWLLFWKKIGSLKYNTFKKLQVAYRCMPLVFENADLIYLPFGGLAVKYADLFEISPIPIVFSLRGSDIRIEPLVNLDYARALQRVITKASQIHCVSEDIKQYAIRLSGLDAQKFQVIYTSVNSALWNEPAHFAADGVLKIIATGRLDWKKGFEHGMMAVAELQKRGVSCTWEIIGEGPHRVALEWAARDLGLQDVVVFTGAKKHEEVIQHLNQADVFFHPSVSEGLSNSVLEGMAAGLPVVVSDVGGMAEAVENGIQGFLTPPRDWQAMANRLESLARDPALRQSMGEAGLKRVSEKFSRNQQIEGFKQFFQAVRQHA